MMTLPLCGLVGGLFAFLSARTATVVGLWSLVLRTKWAQARRVYQLAFAPGQARSELKAAAQVLAFDAMLISLSVKVGLIRFAEFSLGATVATFALFFVWYEVWFYVTHRALHSKLLYRFHKQHHVAHVTHPLTALSFSLVERAVLLLGAYGLAAVLAPVMPLTQAGLVGYLFFTYLLNSWGHTNVELMPAWWADTWPGRFFITASYHAMHHARYDGHYGLFTQVLDRLFGSYWPDAPEVHRRAAQGDGLRQLGARLTPDK